MLRDVGDAALEGNLALGGVFSDRIRLCAYNVKDYVVAEVPFELFEPAAHFLKGVGIGDVIAENACICTCFGTFSQTSNFLEYRSRDTAKAQTMGMGAQVLRLGSSLG